MRKIAYALASFLVIELTLSATSWDAVAESEEESLHIWRSPSPIYDDTALESGIIGVSDTIPASAESFFESPASSWTAEGDQADAQFGYCVASAGDVNGDGYDDVIIGADGYDNGQTDEGRAFVYLGSASGLSATSSWTAESDQSLAHFGYSVAPAGDVNGDGYDDVIIGAWGYDNGEDDEGRAYLYLGSSTGLSVTPSWTVESDQVSALLGASVAAAGDVNGDGFDDVIIGVRDYNGDGGGEGRACLYLGSSSALSTIPSWAVEGGQADAQFGSCVASAGDVNGDGFDDIIVGARGYDNGETDEGRVCLYLGSLSGPSTTPSWIAEGNQAHAQFGSSVAAAGDVNGDGFGDVVIGAHWFEDGEWEEGRAYLYLGSASGLSVTPSWTAEGDQVSAHFGVSVSSVGDVNDDGCDDVAIGALFYDNGEMNEGRVNLYLGSTSGLSATPSWTVESNQTEARFGCSVAPAGDVNDDGFDDIIVGAWGYDNGETDEGSAFVYLGCQMPSPEDEPETPPPGDTVIGVDEGDWIKLEYRISNAPYGTSLPSWIMVEFLSVGETEATVRITMHMTDGSEEEATAPIDVTSGGEVLGLSGFVIPVDTCSGDMVCVGGYEDVWITGETTRKYAGASRTVVYASVYGFGFEGDYYWDKQTGVLVEVNGISSGISVVAQAIETNMWDPEPSDILSSPTVLLALAMATCAAIAIVALMVRRRRKAPPKDENSKS